MKSIKQIACIAIGLVALGVANVHAAKTGPLSIAITTYEQSVATVDGVATYTSTKTTLNNAKILAKIVDALGITLPAGAKLAVSTDYDYLAGIYPGDVVIVNANGVVLYDLAGYGTDVGYVDLSVWYWDAVSESKNSLKSQTVTSKGYGGLLMFIEKYDQWVSQDSEEVIDGYGMYVDTDDNVGSFQYTRGNSGNQLTTGSMTFSGGGEIQSWVGDNDGDIDNYYEAENWTYQPAIFTVGLQGTSVPWGNYPLTGNLGDD